MKKIFNCGKTGTLSLLRRVAAVILSLAVLMSASGCTALGKKGPDNTFDAAENPFEFVRQLGVGWNLGNSLDALGNGSGSETAWGNPATTREMILDIQKMGFSTVRIPVSWCRHIDKEGTVDAAWMARVKEVVDYAYDAGMFVIINTHHDLEYYSIGGSVISTKTKEADIEKMKKLWTQIAEEYEDYDEHLIFETLNEPRTEHTPNEWSGGTAPERHVVDEFNREIVGAIRATGGNNAVRYIMVPGYGATSDISLLMETELPEDENIIMSIHAYSPYEFAMKGSGSDSFTDSDRRELDRLFRAMNEFMQKKGVPIIIGECGATNKDNLADRCALAEYYVAGAGQYGIPCVVWDNNNGTGKGEEIFGLYNRNAGEWYYSELAEAYVKAADSLTASS